MSAYTLSDLRHDQIQSFRAVKGRTIALLPTCFGDRDRSTQALLVNLRRFHRPVNSRSWREQTIQRGMEREHEKLKERAPCE